MCVRGAAWQHLALLATLGEPRAWRTSFLPGAGHEAAPPAIGRTDRPRLAETPAPAPWDAGRGGLGRGRKARRVPSRGSRAPPGELSLHEATPSSPRRVLRVRMINTSGDSGLSAGWGGVPDSCTRDLWTLLRQRGLTGDPLTAPRSRAGGAHGTCSMRLGGLTKHLLGAWGPPGTCGLRPGR